MIKITLEHINQLIQLESQVNYDTPPPHDEDPFIVIIRDSPVLVSAPHGAITFRNNKKEEIWHEEDEYTAGIALLLGELCQASVIVTNFKNEQYDPNFNCDENVPYKRTIRSLIEESGVKFVLDLHGAALYSSKLDPNQIIDLGFRDKSEEKRSMSAHLIQILENYLHDTGNRCDPKFIVVGHNRFAARSRGTITSFVFHLRNELEKDIQAVQIEMKPQVRVAHRLTSASLYKSCGPYAGNPDCVLHMLHALSNFISFLSEYNHRGRN